MGKHKAKLSPRKKTERKPWIRPRQYRIADKATLEQILNPPPKPPPEFQGQEYVAGLKTETKFLYLCTEPNCSAKFITSLALTLHQNKHLNRNIRCSFCRLLFKTEQDLIHHKSTFHPDLEKNPDANPLQCQKCSRIARDSKALWRHVRETHHDKTFPCPHCNFHYKYPENLKEHLKVKHADLGYQPAQKFPCKYCPRVFVYKNSLQSHVRADHRESKTFRCVICDTVYTNLVVYKHHIKAHCCPTYITCEICTQNFFSYGHLRRHMESKYHKLAAEQCKDTKLNGQLPKIVTVKSVVNPNLTPDQLKELCFKTRVEVSLHRVDQRIMHRSVAQYFRRSSKLQKVPIKLSKSPEKIYYCMYCDVKFDTVTNVTSHEQFCRMKIRSKKIHICPVCDKEFDQSFKLKIHSRTHSSERSYPCSYCNAMFKTWRTKAEHEKILHFGILPASYNYEGQSFPCAEPGCGKVYSRPEGLRRHKVAVHVGTRYTCKECDRTYKEKKSYQSHLRRDHAECPIRLECKPCKRTYKTKKTYLDHLERKRHLGKVEHTSKRQTTVETTLDSNSD